MSLNETIDRLKREREASNPLDLIRIEVSRECAEWLLSDIAKRRKALEQAVADPHTKPGKRDKKNRELSFVAYSTDIINYALNSKNQKGTEHKNQ